MKRVPKGLPDMTLLRHELLHIYSNLHDQIEGRISSEHCSQKYYFAYTDDFSGDLCSAKMQYVNTWHALLVTPSLVRIVCTGACT